MSELFGHLPKDDIVTIVRDAPVGLGDYHWLFVVIDSIPLSEGGFDRTRVSKYLNESESKHWWADEGLWIPGEDIQKALSGKVVVPFSAAYIFGSEVSGSKSPGYRLTSESERFDESIPIELQNAIQQIGAKGYVADGCGLNYCILDEVLYRLLVTRTTTAN